MAPTLTTARLTLRPHECGDFADMVALWSDPEVVRYIGGAPCAPSVTWARLLRYVGHWAVIGYGYWVICDRNSGRYLGEAGFADFQRDLTPRLDGIPEAGWVLSPEDHGRGIATEALVAMTDWADAQPGFDRTACLIAPENAASLKLAAKLGYGDAVDTTYDGHPSRVLFRDRT